MRYEDFKKKVVNMPILSGRYLHLLYGGDKGFLVQLRRWVKSGRVIRLRKGLYLLNSDDRKVISSRMFIARELYGPSYISMEYALSFYGLIPERVSDITSITTKKTAVYNNFYGRFVYQHVKENCFQGFREERDEAGLGYLLASPEKALIDFLYLNQHKFQGDFRQVARDNFRLQNLDTLDNKKLLEYAALFGGKKLTEIVKTLK